MAVTAKDVYELLDKIDHHARSIAAVHTEVRAMLAQVNFLQPDDPFKCPSCGNGYQTERALALHVQNVHDGPAVPMSEEELRA